MANNDSTKDLANSAFIEAKEAKEAKAANLNLKAEISILKELLRTLTEDVIGQNRTQESASQDAQTLPIENKEEMIKKCQEPKGRGRLNQLCKHFARRNCW